MAHHHHHSHSHAAKDNGHLRTVIFVLLITASFMFVELLYGYWTNSLALLADGVHMLTDVASLALTAFAFVLSQRPATASKTFGYYRIEVFAAFLNSLFLSVIAVGVMVSAYLRLHEPPDVEFRSMLVVAVIGLILNLISGWILHKGSKDNLNLRGAFLHVMGDALASVGTIVAGVLIWWQGWMMADSIASIVISVIILISAYQLMSETLHLILQGVPLHVNTDDITSGLRKVEGVRDIHHLHVWALNNERVVLTVHLVVSKDVDSHQALCAAQKKLRDEFHISHTTIQVETEDLKARESNF